MARMYCPNCRYVTSMAAVGHIKQPKGKWRLYYKRTRRCGSCQKTITTIEVEESFINELDEQKVLVSEIHRLTRPVSSNQL